MSGTRAITLKLDVRDADTVRQQLLGMGEAGENALKRLDDAAKRASAGGGMPALGAATRQTDQAMQGLAARAGPLGQVLSSFGAAGLAAAAGIGALSLGLGNAIRQAEQFQRLQLRTEAVIRATGGTAGMTAREIRAFSQELARETLASAEGVEEAAQKLLTFRSISGETFTRTLRAAQDLAAVGFGTLDSAATQLGKALENPAEGLAALTRVGVTFTAAQRDLITTLVETGNAAEAQRIILAAVEQQVGGAGRAEAGGLAGAYDSLSQNVQEFLTRVGNTGPIQIATAAVNGLAAAVRLLDEAVFRTSRYTPEAITGRLSALRTELADIEGQIDGPAPARGAGAGLSRLQLDQMSARAAFVRQEIARIVAEQARGEADRTAAAAAGAAERDRLEREAAASALEELRRSTNQRLQVERTYQQQVATIRRAERSGAITAAEAATEIAAAEARQRDALARLDQPRRGGGGRASTADTARDFNAALTEQRQLVQSLETPYETYVRRLEQLASLQDRLTAAQRAGVAGAAPLSDEQVQRAAERYQRDLEKAEEQTSRTNDTARELQMTFASAFEDAIIKGKDFSEVLKSIEQDLARIILRQVVTQPLANATSGLINQGIQALGGLFSGGTTTPTTGGVSTGRVNALGNAFLGGRVTPFALGGVVNGPTLFPMANGMGLMGEAGPEAVMPLDRDSRGRLGVRAQGGGGSVVQNISIDARGADPTVVPLIRAAMAQAKMEAKAELLADIDRGGRAAKVVRRRA